MNQLALDLGTNVESKLDRGLIQHLQPPTPLEVGTILTLRMRGHSRTGGADYFAPAVVLEQFQPRGEITCLIWDSTSGNAFQHAYPIREVTSMDRLVDDGNGGHVQKRIEYEAQSNIGQVLFSPRQFAFVIEDIQSLTTAVGDLAGRVVRLEKEFDYTKPPATGTATGQTSPSLDLKGKK